MENLRTKWAALTSFYDRMRNALTQAKTGDEELLSASVLIQSFALAEAAAADRLKRDISCVGQIEDWGTTLLEAHGKSWANVRGGKVGIVEVAVVRNTYAHGSREIGKLGRDRLARAEAEDHVGVGSIPIDYERLNEFRSRLRSLLSHCGLG